MTALGSRLRTPHQVALADDAHEFVLRPDDWNTAYPVPEQNLGDLLHRGLRPDGYDVGNHDIGGFHESHST